jgi:hypothetical protein
MAWNLAISALAIVFILAALLSGFGAFSKSAQSERALESYLLAGASLSRTSIVSLLLSSSFGLNGLFYQVWLGFTVGAWGLVAQGAWALSFVLLARYASVIRGHKSLHDLLGVRFGAATRAIAGLCSVVGIMYLMGWEVGIGNATLSGLLSSAGDLTTEESMAGANWLTIGIVFGCLLYTVLGGLRGNAAADLLLNIVKLIAVCTLTYLLLNRFFAQPQSSLWTAMFPSVATMKENLGWWGLITNIAFSLAWQFVDTSTWQSVIAGAKASEGDTAWNLRWSGLAVFIAPGIIGTLLGVSLVGSSDITQDNILAKAVALAPSLNGVVLFLVFIAIVACVMSMIDGLFLAAAYALVVDIIHPRARLAELDSVSERADRLLTLIRVALVVIAVVAIWGVRFLLAALNLSLFDFIYIVIITQLSLIGPVLAALLSNRGARFPLWLPILIALAVGFGSIMVGTRREVKWIIDGAGAFTIFASCIATLVATRSIVSSNIEKVTHAQ